MARPVSQPITAKVCPREYQKALRQEILGSEVRHRKRQELDVDAGLEKALEAGCRSQRPFPGYSSESSIGASASDGVGLAVGYRTSSRPTSKLSIQHPMSMTQNSTSRSLDGEEPVGERQSSYSSELQDILHHQTSGSITPPRKTSLDLLQMSLTVFTSSFNGFRRVSAIKMQSVLLRRMERLVKSKVFVTVLTLVSLFALYGDDLRLAFSEKEDDEIFNWITIVSLCLFTFEISLSCIALRDYAFSFFFFLDVISTISLVLDLTFVWEALVGYEGFSIEDQTSSDQGDDAVGQAEYARAGRSSRVGTRMVRMLRVLRLVRMTRIFKFFLTKEDKEAKRNMDLVLLPGNKTDSEVIAVKESRVGQKLSERTTLWVIVLVLAMLIFIPLLQVGDILLMMASSAEYGADVITQAWEDFLSAERAGASASMLMERRLYWEEQLLTYIAYHNHDYAKCPANLADGAECTADMLFKLCFFGFVAKRQPNGDSSLASRDHTLSTNAWDMFWNSLSPRSSLKHVPGEFPADIEARILQPWSSTCSKPGADMYGVSLLRNEPCPWRTRRPQEITWFWALHAHRGRDTSSQGRMVFFFDVAESIKWQAIMSIFQTTFIIGILLIGSIFFSKDADALVLSPIETMITKVNHIRQDPLYATTMGDEIHRKAHLAIYKHKSSPTERFKYKLMSWCRRFRRKTQERLLGKRGKQERERPQRASMPSEIAAPERRPLETKILENTIIKLGSLLALGFGEAGTDIVGGNLGDDGATVNVLSPGRSVEAIYGYCQINNFTSTTEVLGEKTVVLVNKVALIVHTTIDQHLGSANKNMGEAFLLIWRLDRFGGDLRKKIADLSVLSFIQVVVEVNRDADLAAYREHPGLLARHENYRVSLTFGLHVGYSIEGAIGSEFKIDASYLSSHVTLATCLGSLALCYDCMILMSEPLVCCCSGIFQFHFRAIDRVLMEGAKAPIRIFTIDLDSDAIFVNHSKYAPRRDPNRYIARMVREEMKQSKLDESYEPIVSFNTDRHIQRMRAVYFLEFFQDFEKAFLNYEAGEWSVACQVLFRTCQMLRKRTWHYDKLDGPSCALLDYMHGFKYKAPLGWPGFRKVSEINRLHVRKRCIVEI